MVAEAWPSYILYRVRHLAPVTVLLTLATGACGASEAQGDDAACPVANSNGCAQPRGVYRTSYVERRGGTCGARPDVQGTASAVRVTQFGPPCSGTVDWSEDFCSASFVAHCPEEETGPGFTNEHASATTYAEDALTRTGTFRMTIFDAAGDLYCESTYDTFSVNTSCQK